MGGTGALIGRFEEVLAIYPITCISRCFPICEEVSNIRAYS